jgi:hypothetical protein
MVCWQRGEREKVFTKMIPVPQLIIHHMEMGTLHIEHSHGALQTLNNGKTEGGRATGLARKMFWKTYRAQESIPPALESIPGLLTFEQIRAQGEVLLRS